jgi:SAM-dependent methyltransferase
MTSSIFNQSPPVIIVNSGQPTTAATARQASKDLRSFYNDLAEEWARDTEMFRDDLISRPIILQLAQEMGTGRVILDCGCGDGNLARLLSLFAKEVIGVDVSPKMLAEARKRSNEHRNVHYVEGDMLKLRETARLRPDSIDLCVAVYAVCCMENRDQLAQVFRQIYEVLRPGGQAIIQIPQPLESYFKTSSGWATDELPPESYYDSGRLVYRRLKTVNGRRIRVARYHFTLSDYLNAILAARLSLQQVLEPRPSNEVIAKFPELKHESRLPFSLILLAQK